MMIATDSDLEFDSGAEEAKSLDGSLHEPEQTAGVSPPPPPGPTVRRVLAFGVAVVVVLSALVGWLGFRTYEARQVQTQQLQLVQAARQGALNLTTIDWQNADADVRRILDGATGQFYDDFAMRSQPFIDVVRQSKAITVGTVTEAGLESQSGDGAQVLVAASVKTSNDGVPEQQPRAWRMRIFVQKVDDGIKVANVEFVP